MNLKEKRDIINILIALLKNSKLNTIQKEKILKVVQNLKNATEMQKERFIKYYGLDGTGCKKLVEMGKLYGKTASTIRGSVITIQLKLARSDEAFEVVERVVNECIEKV